MAEGISDNAPSKSSATISPAEGKKFYMYHKTSGGVSKAEFDNKWDKITWGEKKTSQESNPKYPNDINQRATSGILEDLNLELETELKAKSEEVLGNKLAKGVQDIDRKNATAKINVMLEDSTLTPEQRKEKAWEEEKARVKAVKAKSEEFLKGKFTRDALNNVNTDKGQAAREINENYDEYFQREKRAEEKARALEWKYTGGQQKETPMGPEDTVPILERINREREGGKFKKEAVREAVVPSVKSSDKLAKTTVIPEKSTSMLTPEEEAAILSGKEITFEIVDKLRKNGITEDDIRKMTPQEILDKTKTKKTQSATSAPTAQPAPVPTASSGQEPAAPKPEPVQAPPKPEQVSLPVQPETPLVVPNADAPEAGSPKPSDVPPKPDVTPAVPEKTGEDRLVKLDAEIDQDFNKYVEKREAEKKRKLTPQEKYDTKYIFKEERYLEELGYKLKRRGFGLIGFPGLGKIRILDGSGNEIREGNKLKEFDGFWESKAGGRRAGYLNLDMDKDIPLMSFLRDEIRKGKGLMSAEPPKSSNEPLLDHASEKKPIVSAEKQQDLGKTLEVINAEKATAEKIKIVKNEIANSGEVSAESLSKGLGFTKEKLLRERGLGVGKLGNTIKEIKQSANGNEYFVDGKVAYLPARGEAIFVGDIHGDSGAVESILEQTKFIENMERGNKDQFLVFLGDYADRGGDQVKTVVEVMKLKDRYVNNVVLLRGNHEEKEIGERDGFKNSLTEKYGDAEGAKLFEKYNTMVEEMPGVVVTGNGIIGVHGGIPNEEIGSLKGLNDKERLQQMRWNDPSAGLDERSPNPRGEGIQYFGKKPFERFMEKIGAKTMIRSHQQIEQGSDVTFDGKLTTIFSNGSEKSQLSYYTGVQQAKFARINLAEPKDKFEDKDFSEVTYEKLKTSIPIAEIKAIEETRNQMFKARDEIAKHVELPLVPACEHFWDLNVATLASSANVKDVNSEAYVLIDYDSLSDENKKIAKESAEFVENYDGRHAINFKIPITNETTLEQVRQSANAFAERFKKQRASWIPNYSLQQMREIYSGDPNDTKFGAEAFVKDGWYYDSEGQRFYLSEEHSKKANEKFA